jgi:hypothetical protein
VVAKVAGFILRKHLSAFNYSTTPSPKTLAAAKPRPNKQNDRTTLHTIL